MPVKAHWRQESFSVRVIRAEHHHSKRIWAVRASYSVGRPCTRAALFRIVTGNLEGQNDSQDLYEHCR